MQISRHRLAQRQDAIGRRVAMMAVGQRLAPGFDDMLGSREVGLADSEIDDAAARALQRVGPRQDFKGGLGAEPTHASGQNGHGVGPSPKSYGSVIAFEPATSGTALRLAHPI